MKTNDKKIRRNFLTFLIGFSQIYAWATTYYLPATLVEMVAKELGQSPLIIMGGFSWALLISGLCAPMIGSWIELSNHLVVPEKVNIIFYLLASYAILRSVVGTTISVDILTLFSGLGLTISAAAVVASLIGPSQIVGRMIEMYLGRNFNPLNSSIFWSIVLPVAI